MVTASDSSVAQRRAAALAADLGAYHMDTPIDAIVAGFMTVRVCVRELVWECESGCESRSVISGGWVMSELCVHLEVT